MMKKTMVGIIIILFLLCGCIEEPQRKIHIAGWGDFTKTEINENRKEIIDDFYILENETKSQVFYYDYFDGDFPLLVVYWNCTAIEWEEWYTENMGRYNLSDCYTHFYYGEGDILLNFYRMINTTSKKEG